MIRLLVAATFCSACSPTPAPPADVVVTPVTSVWDGDTFRSSAFSERLRVWGIDAPELEDRPAGPASGNALRSMIDGKDLTCVVIDLDQYDRFVVRCQLDGRDIARAMIDMGHAVEWCRFSGGYYGECDRSDGRSRP